MAGPTTSYQDSSTGHQEPIKGTNGAAHVVEVGLDSQRHNRYFAPAAAMNSHPADDTRCVTWTQAENVRRYRIRVIGGAAGDYIKVVEDAVNGVQAEAWLNAASSSAADDVEYAIYPTSNPATETQFDSGWSEWVELSKDESLPSLSRLDFEASAAATDFAIWVEAE